MAVDTKALAPYQQFDNRQLDIIKKTVAKGLSNEQFLLFVEVCKHYRLNPMARQIYAYSDGSGRMVVQTGIDGFRLMAEETGLYGGQIGPEWCGLDGVWKDVWLEKEPPAAARVGIIRRDFDKPIWGVARYVSYAGKTPIWQKAPDVMLAKCAESLGFRKAFPAKMSGIYTHEEMEQASNEIHVPSYAIQEVKEEVQEVDSEPAPINAGQIKTIQILNEKLGKPELPGVAELTQEDAKAIIVQLNADLREHNAAKASKPAQPVQAPKQEQPKQEMTPDQAWKARRLAIYERAKEMHVFEVSDKASDNTQAFLKFVTPIISATVTNMDQITNSRLDAIEAYLNSKDAA